MGRARTAALKEQKLINRDAADDSGIQGDYAGKARVTGCDRLAKTIVECRVVTRWTDGDVGDGHQSRSTQACVTAHRVIQGSGGKLTVSQPSGTHCSTVDDENFELGRLH